MQEKGNGRPERCVANLLMTVRGEVPYERLKGLDAGMIDRPSTVVAPEARADVEWLICTYEPRANVETVNLEALLTAGHFGLHVGIENK